MDRGGDYSDHNHNSHPTSSWSFDDPVHLHHQNGRHHHHNHGSQQNDSIGCKRHFSPGYADGSTPAKLYVAGVPRTVTEQDIRSLFGEHGNIVEVIPLKDKRTGLQQECCFVKYTKFEEADRAIAVLNNQYTFYGGMLPIKVRYADGERRRQVTEDSGGIWASKLYVGCVNKQALIREIEEIFSPYGLVEDVYIMRDELRQSRGCAFVQFSHRDMAVGAINGLNGVYMMRGCDQPLIVRFADPKKPKTGESRPVSYAPAGPSNADSSDPLDCDWSEHICPDGYKYYYNCVTCESRWEKPEKYSFYEQEVRNGPQQQNPRRQQLNSPSFSQTQLSHQEPQKPSLAVQGLDHVHAQASTSSVVSPTCG